MRIDQVGLVLPTTYGARRLLALDHRHSGRCDRPRQPDAVAACAFDRYDPSRARSMVDDPRQQLREPGAVVGDLAGGDRCPGRERYFYLVGVAWVSTPTTASTISASMGTGPVPS